MTGQTKGASLALIGLLTAAVISVFQASGHFDLFDCLTGLLLFFIAEEYKEEIPAVGSGAYAFAMIEGAAFFLIVSPINAFNTYFGNQVTEIILGLIWLCLSFYAYLKRKTQSWSCGLL